MGKLYYDYYSHQIGVYHIIKKRFKFIALGLLSALFLFLATGLANAYTFPSTNDANRTNGHPHVNFVTNDIDGVTLEFINETNSLAFFEYRIDGVNAGSTSHPIVTGSTIHPGIGLDNRSGASPQVSSKTESFTANQKVEVRLALGGERNWDFDWTQFDVINLDGTQFVNDPKYVRAGNGGDLSTQLVAPDFVTAVNFIVDGNTGSPISGTNIGGAGSDTDWWRLYTPLSPGEHEITARVQVNGDWYDVNDSAIAYSLDSPTASYVLPNNDKNIFRPSDNPVRLKIEDEFNQFKRMVVVIDSTTHEVLRSQCDLRAAGNYLLCDVDQSLSWSDLSEGSYSAKTTTYTQANNRVDNLMSDSFVVDGTAPEVFGLEIENETSGLVGNPVKVAAEASDYNGVESVNFYVTEPRSDGACTGNGAKLAEHRQFTASSDGKYRAELSVPGLNGDYCVTAVSRDHAYNNSSSMHKKVSIDTEAPLAEITNPNDSDIVNGTVTISGEITDENPSHYYLVIKDSSETIVDGPEQVNQANVADYEWDTTTLPDGEYTVFLATRDKAGNKDGNATTDGVSVDSINVTVDNNAPNVEINNPADESIHDGPVDLRAKVTDDNPHHYWLQIKKNGSVINIPGVTGTQNDTDSFTNQLLTTLNDEGEYEVTLAARDAAGGGQSTGNRSGDVIIKFIIDKSDPEIDISNVNVSNDKKLSFDLLATDNGPAGLQIVAANIYDETNTTKLIELGSGSPTRLNDPHSGLAVGTPSFSTALSDIDVSSLAPGIYTIRAYAKDHAINELRFELVQFTIFPVISNEASTNPTTTSMTIVWDTDHPTTSRVIYDDDPHSEPLGSSIVDGYETYGYEFTTEETDASPKVTSHSVTVTGLTPGTTYYFRTVSHGSPESVSDEIVASTNAPQQTSSNNNSFNSNSSNNNGNTGATAFNTTPFNTFGTFGTTTPTDDGNVLSTNDDENANNNEESNGEVQADAAGVSSATAEQSKGSSGWSWWWMLPIIAALILLLALWRRRSEQNEA